MALKKGDFVELEYEGRISATDQVFDSTKGKPVVACIGAGMLLKAIEDALVGRAPKEEFEIELKPEQAFGARNPKLIQLTSVNAFRKQNINPFPGLQLSIDGALATVRSVTGGRVILDFNHPLAGKALKFKIKILGQVADAKEKIKAFCTGLGKPDIEIKEREVIIKVEKELPESLQKIKTKKIREYVPEIKDKEVKFVSNVVQKTKA